MEIKYNDSLIGRFRLPFRRFRKVAYALKLKYFSLEEGRLVECWGKEDAEKLGVLFR